MTVRDVIALKEVINDLRDGKIFYDRMQKGIGDYFWDCMITDIESLFIYAGIHDKRNGLYRMFSRRFPYAIYYDIKNEVAYVIAALPMRRNPAWIDKKLKDSISY